MTLIVWSDDFSVGVEALDRDHIVIFSLINHIHEACQSGTDTAAIARILEVLREYALDHFRREEALFEKHGYEALGVHRAEHESITAQLGALYEAYRDNPSPAVAADIVELLAFWLESHILNDDMAYKPVLAGAAGNGEAD